MHRRMGLLLIVAIAATGLLAANRHLRDVLTSRGYRVQYFEVFGAHEPVHWRRTLPELLMSVLS